MKRFLLINFTIILFAIILPLSAAADSLNSQWIQLSPTTPESLNKFINKTGLFAKAKAPTAKKTILHSIEIDTNSHYSVYTMQPLAVYGKVTQYKTTEHINEGSRFPGIPIGHMATVHGKGLSLGGIFWPKENMVVYAPSGKLIYDNRIDVTAIKPVSGHLFPLQVGNILKFDFKRIHSRMIGGKTTVKNETGVMTYKVTRKFNNFNFSSKKIPGPIYEIEVWESTNYQRKPYLTDIYEYSNGFHWYISDKYFTKRNKLIAWYRVKTWS
jgi:hypothetical protein